MAKHYYHNGKIGEAMTIVDRLRGLDVDPLTVDQMVELRLGARQLEQEYLTNQYEVPEWLRECSKLLDGELARRRADQNRKRLKEIEAGLLNLESTEDKRKRLIEERDRLMAAQAVTV